jgi:transcriptional regulator with XRE-family HTH domain
MIDRYFGSRVKRLYREKGWSMAAFSRRTDIGRSVLKRIMETRGYVDGITQAQVDQLARALNVTRDYLERGHTPGDLAIAPGALASATEISRLRAQLDRLRRRQPHVQETIARATDKMFLTYMDNERLEVRRRGGKVIVVQDGEYEIAEADTLKGALQIALDHQGDND